jgi:hypothetical protein
VSEEAGDQRTRMEEDQNGQVPHEEDQNGQVPHEEDQNGRGSEWTGAA